MPMLALIVAAATVASPVAVTKHKSADGGHAMTHEVVVAAPVAEVWRAISTAEGWESWAVPTAWSPQPDIIETSYTPTAEPDDPTTIKQQVLFAAPERLMLFRTVKAPDGFPDFDTFAKVTNLFEVEPVGEGRTRVRLIGTGYAGTAAGQRLLAAFEHGNTISLQNLAARFGATAVAPALSAQLSPLGYLVGHCWAGEFKGGAETDTHCFEALYGGRHVRDVHEVRKASGERTYAGETIYSWNGKAGRIEYTYVSSDGGVSRGSVKPVEGALDFGDEVYNGPDGKELRISTLWKRSGETAYDAISRSSANATGQRVVTYRRADQPNSATSLARKP